MIKFDDFFNEKVVPYHSEYCSEGNLEKEFHSGLDRE